MAMARASVRGASARIPRSFVMSRLETSIAPAIRATDERSRVRSPAVTAATAAPVAAKVSAIAPRSMMARDIEFCTFLIVVGLRFRDGMNAGHLVRQGIMYGDLPGLSTHFGVDRSW